MEKKPLKKSSNIERWHIATIITTGLAAFAFVTCIVVLVKLADLIEMHIREVRSYTFKKINLLEKQPWSWWKPINQMVKPDLQHRISHLHVLHQEPRWYSQREYTGGVQTRTVCVRSEAKERGTFWGFKAKGHRKTKQLLLAHGLLEWNSQIQDLSNVFLQRAQVMPRVFPRQSDMGAEYYLSEIRRIRIQTSH